MNSEQSYHHMHATSSGFTPVLALISSKIGAGMVVLPYAMAQLGLLLGTALCILISFAFCYYYTQLVLACRSYEVSNVIQLTEKVYGRTIARGVQHVLNAMSGCTMILLIVLSGVLTSSLAASFYLVPPNSNWISFVIVGLSLLWWVPLLLSSEQSWLSSLALLRIVGIGYAITLIGVQMPEYTDTVTTKLINVDGVSAVGLVMYSFDAVPVLPTLVTSGSKRVWWVLGVAYTSLLLFTLVLAGLACISYKDQVPEIILFRPCVECEFVEFDWWMVFARICMGVALISSVPLIVYKLRESTEKHSPSVVGLVVFAMAGVIGTLYPVPIFYFKLLGGFFSPLVSFVIPSILFLKSGRSLCKKVLLFAGALFILAVALQVFI